MKTSGIEALLEMLAQQGVRYIFGNPGTTELAAERRARRATAASNTSSACRKCP